MSRRKKSDPRGMSVKCRLARNSAPMPSGCLLWVGSMNDQGYGSIFINGRNIRAHRVAWEEYRHQLSKGDIVDHICGERSCIAIDHLRVATKAENTQYRVRINRNNTSGYRNVHWHSQERKWVVSVHVNGVRHSGGLFDTPEEANEKAIAMRRELFGEFGEPVPASF